MAGWLAWLTGLAGPRVLSTGTRVAGRSGRDRGRGYEARRDRARRLRGEAKTKQKKKTGKTQGDKDNAQGDIAGSSMYKNVYARASS